MTRPSHASDQASRQDCCMFSALPHSYYSKGLVGWMGQQGMSTFFPFNSQLRLKDEKGHSLASLQKSPPDLIHNPTCLYEVEVYCVVLATILPFNSLEPMQIQ